ncbi:tripartite tricarboxylate transporter substrate binding protein [Arsenicitalea aurantiaca]|uniref:Tripartite tricarboxylate transporter substrate binding protein n=1 Tax=Arsenicitalea aurantiaca TaxID=1783274 RepID=A0A433XLD9_9HYPH|nr:tripartite tricarboxylate transporter substrate binding protein [Arsenicitalea aurantiaca]RUT34808.1 tripartite tricarboxylate transporter substrate binding protein [Arsenicitalea aurantiaca]
MNLLKALAATLVVGCAALSATGANAQDFPTEPIKVIVPYAPGGVTDLLARTFQRAIGEAGTLSQPITVVNMAGAGSTVGTRHVMSAKPDGHTLLLHHLGLLSGQAAGMWEHGFADFAPIAGTTRYCHVLAVSASSPYDDLAGFLQDARENPDTIVFGANLGGAIHMAGLVVESLDPEAKLRFAQIGGEVDNIAAIKGNIIQATALSVGSYNQYKAEGLKALFAMAPERAAEAQDIPTGVELGYPDSSLCVQHSWYAPAGTPPEVVSTLADALEGAMNDETVKAFFAGRSMEMTFVRGDALTADLEATYAQFAPLAAGAMAPVQ